MTRLVKPRRPAPTFAAIPSLLAQDPTISLAAKGLYGFLRSPRDGTDVSIPALCRRLGDSEGSITRARRELIDSGYARETVRRGSDGTVQGRVFELFNEPITPAAQGESPAVVQDTDADAADVETTGRRSNTDRTVEDHAAARSVDVKTAVEQQAGADGAPEPVALQRTAAAASRSILQTVDFQGLVIQGLESQTLGFRTMEETSTIKESRTPLSSVLDRERVERRAAAHCREPLFALSAAEIDTQSDEQLVRVVLDDIESRVLPGNRGDRDTADRIVASMRRGELNVRVIARLLSDPKIQYLSQIRRQLPALVAESQRIKVAAAAAQEKSRQAEDRVRHSFVMEQERLMAQECLRRLTQIEVEQLLAHARTLLPIKSRHAQLERLVSSRSLGDGIFPVTICAALRALRPASSDTGIRTQTGGAESA